MGLRAVRKYFNGRPWRAVHQQLRAPVKVILLAGVRANGKLEFAHRANRVAGALRGFPRTRCAVAFLAASESVGEPASSSAVDFRSSVSRASASLVRRVVSDP